MGNVIEDDELELTEVTDEDGFELDEEGEVTDSAEPAEGEVAEGEDINAPTKSAEELKAEADAKAKAEKKAERDAANEVALNSFQDIVAGVFESDERDATTGEPSTKQYGEVGAAYGAFASRAGQNAAIAWLNTKMQEKLLEAGTTNPGAFVEARTYLELSNHVKSIGQVKETITKQPVDPTELHVARVAALLLSPNFVAVPDGVKDNWQELAREKANSLHEAAGTYIAWMRKQEALTDEERAAQSEEDSAEPVVDDIVKRAAQVAAGRGVGGAAPRKRAPKGEGATSAPRTPYEGTRRDIGEHIKSAFEGVEVGAFLTVGEIVKHVSSEYPEGPENRPSQGAVAARLFPKSGNCTIENVRPEGPAQGRSHKGAVKTA